MNIVYRLLQTLIMFLYVLPTQVAYQLASRIHGHAARLYYAIVVRRRRLMGEPLWQPQDWAYLGIGPPPGSPAWEEIPRIEVPDED